MVSVPTPLTPPLIAPPVFTVTEPLAVPVPSRVPVVFTATADPAVSDPPVPTESIPALIAVAPV